MEHVAAAVENLDFENPAASELANQVARSELEGGDGGELDEGGQSPADHGLPPVSAQTLVAPLEHATVPAFSGDHVPPLPPLPENEVLPLSPAFTATSNSGSVSHASWRSTLSASSHRSKLDAPVEELIREMKLAIGRGSDVHSTQEEFNDVRNRVHDEVIKGGILVMEHRPGDPPIDSVAADIYCIFDRKLLINNNIVWGLLVTLGLQHTLHIEKKLLSRPLFVPGIAEVEPYQDPTHALALETPIEACVDDVLRFIRNWVSLQFPIASASDDGWSSDGSNGSRRSSRSEISLGMSDHSDGDMEIAAERLERLGYPWATSDIAAAIQERAMVRKSCSEHFFVYGVGPERRRENGPGAI